MDIISSTIALWSLDADGSDGTPRPAGLLHYSVHGASSCRPRHATYATAVPRKLGVVGVKGEIIS